MSAVFNTDIADEAEADKHSALVDLARSAGKAAYEAKEAEIGDAGAAGFVVLILQITAATKPLLRCLSENAIGGVGGWSLDYEITHSGLGVDALVQSMEVQLAGLEAFAAELRKNGFNPVVRSQVD